MDFKAALAQNIKPFESSTQVSPVVATEAQAMASTMVTLVDSSKENGIKETASKRRRRRRHNNALKHLLGLSKASEPEHLIEENRSNLYNHKEGKNEGPPSVHVVLASPTLLPCEDAQIKERISLDVLKAIADRARDRLAVRIQAYWDEKQYVAEAAAKIQRAYSQHMESQLHTIIQAMGEHLSREIDIRFAAHSEKSQEVLRQSIAEIRIESAHNQRHNDDKLREHQGRIAALEAQTKSILDMLKCPPLNPGIVSNGTPDASLHVHSRMEQLHDLLQDLRLNYQDMTKRMKEMQTTLASHVVNRDHKVHAPTNVPSQPLADISNSQPLVRLSSSPVYGIKEHPKSFVKRTPTTNVVIVGSVECL
ncbi:hypothetical protein PIIN_05560 [Serendipita indica DSM 11827]|uniref:Uncharacterized protein n=1 Tax=Serendipita indica (strain DSM 11827) TaxID=1109443 RepID=G4TJY1_SERID|nr:hypothetical protein PIIN_05560 [Serendipita indica DSM 11827]